jgi:insulysin
MKEVLSAGYLHNEYKPELITDILNRLTTGNVTLMVVGQKFKDKIFTANLSEKWYGTKYSLEPISADDFQKWNNAGLHESLHLPLKNEFIPSNFDIVKRDKDASAVPVILRNTKMTRLWYKQDDKFLLPKAFITVDFNSPYAYMDPLSANLTYMFVTLLNDSLTEYTYDADLAGLRYDLQGSIYGLVLSVRGYNDKQHVLLEKLMEKITSLEIDPQRFDILLENYIRRLKNFRAEAPHQHAIYYTNMLTSELQWTKEELLEATDEVSVEKLKPFIPRLFSQLFTEMLVYGNVTKERSNMLADIIERILTDKCQTRPLLDGQLRRFREVQLPDGVCYVYRRNNEVHKSSSLEVYYQCSVQETKANMLLELFCQIISEPCFDILRTREQLGYIVFSGVRRSNGVQGLRVIVQSDRTPEYVESRVEAFLHNMKTHIAEMADNVFEKHVSALSTKRLEKPKKLSAQNSRYLNEISTRQYNFERDEIEVGCLKSLTKEDVLTFYKELIAHDAPKRHKLSVHVVSTATPDSTNESEAAAAPVLEQAADGTDGNQLVNSLAQMSEITDVNNFKRELGLFPLPKPFPPIDMSNKSKL